MENLGTTVRQLLCPLTSEELQALGSELAQAVQDRANEESRQVSLKAEMKARASEIDARVTRLSLLITRQEEYRAVTVQRVLQEDGMVIEKRADTGQVLAVRPLHDDERQLCMAPESVADMVAEANRAGADEPA